jgi:hypothetical protein
VSQCPTLPEEILIQGSEFMGLGRKLHFIFFEDVVAFLGRYR